MRKLKSVLRILAMVPLFLLFFSCNPIQDDSKSDSMLLVVKITATDIEENEVNFLQSDVVVIDPDTGAATVSDDGAVVTLTAKLLDPAPLFGTSQHNDIFVDRYVVTYIRSDGKREEGADVPYSFEGSLSSRVEVDSEVDVSFVIVRAVAKLEPPLINMREGRGEGELKVTAKIDFYGQDTLGNTVTTTGYLTIFFADYITEEESGG